MKGKIHFTSLLKPMIYLVLLSLIYGAGFVALTLGDFKIGGFGLQVLQWLWLSVFGLGLYFVCLVIWGLKRGGLTLKKAGLVLAWNLASSGILTFGLLALESASSLVFVLLSNVLGALGILFLVPCTLIYYRLTDLGLLSIFRFVQVFKDCLKNRYGTIFNAWLIFFLAGVLWDSMFAGPLMLPEDLNMATLCIHLMYMSQPFLYLLLILFFAAGSGELALLAAMSSLAAIFILANYIAQFRQLDLTEGNKENPPLRAKRKTRQRR